MMPASLFSLLIDLTPTVPSDRKIRGGLQQIHSKAVVHRMEVWQKF
jgi:hypothetical protein